MEIFASIPALAKLFEKWIDLEKEKIPMKKDAHKTRQPVREEDAKWDTERRRDKGEKRNDRRDRKQHKRNKRKKKD